MEIVETSLDSSLFVDERQIGLVRYREGRAIITAKIIKPPSGGPPFARIPTAYRRGNICEVVEYEEKEWRKTAEELLDAFKAACGEQYYSL